MYEPLIHIVLYQPEIPPNTGNVGRTCVALGAKLWLVRPLGFDISEKARRRAGLDYWQYLNWEVVDDWEQLLQRLPQPRFWLFTKRGTRTYTDIGFQAGDALVFGRETAGLPPELLERYPDCRVRIPMRPEVRSLNLACSVGVAAYEAVRQIGLENLDFPEEGG
jgi:tRNA (cytidine/uridine-2'-O-)-methyltransferase